MFRSIYITLIALFLSATWLLAQSPNVEFASSLYRKTSGRIGPDGVVATHTFDLHINSVNTIILNGIITSGYQVYGNNMIIPPVRDDLMKLKLVIKTHQKKTSWYSAELTFNEVTVPLEVIKKEPVIDSDPAVILEVRSKRGINRVIKFEFDNTSAGFNK